MAVSQNMGDGDGSARKLEEEIRFIVTEFCAKHDMQ